MQQRRALLATALLLAACADAGSDRINPDTLAQSPLEQLWAVGGVADTALIFETLTRNDVALGPAGRLFVIDRTAGRIAVLDSSGQLVDSWGAPGPGPGEFIFPLTIAVAPDGAVHVYDAEKSRVVAYSADGEFRDETVTSPGRPFRFRFREDGSIVGSSPRESTLPSLLLTGSAGDWQVLDSIPAGTTGMIESVCGIIGYTVEPVFHPLLAWDARGDTIVSSTGDFSLTLRRSGAPPRVIARDTAQAPTNTELARRELGPGRSIQLRGRRPCTIPTDQLLEVATVAPYVPAYTDLTLAHDGYVWATRDVRADEPTVADVFHLDSGFVRTITLGTARPALFLSDGTLISIETDEDDVPSIVAYRVPRDLLSP